MAKKKLTKHQISLIARNYVRAMFDNQDGFYLDEEGIISESDEIKITKEIQRVSEQVCPDSLYLNIGDSSKLVETIAKMTL